MASRDVIAFCHRLVSSAMVESAPSRCLGTPHTLLPSAAVCRTSAPLGLSSVFAGPGISACEQFIDEATHIACASRQVFGFHRELIRPPYLNPLEMVSSAMAKRVCDLIPESLAGQVCCVRPSSAASSAVKALSSLEIGLISPHALR